MFLNISKVTMYDGGMYTCIVENSLGNLSRSFQLIIQGRSFDRPVFISKSNNVTRYVGDNVTFECLFYSDTSPFIQWFVQRKSREYDLEFLKVKIFFLYFRFIRWVFSSDNHSVYSFRMDQDLV